MVKLRIDVSQGVFDIEGDPDLVREIYFDFKEHLLAREIVRAPLHDDALESNASEDAAKPHSKPKRKPIIKKRVNGDDAGSTVSPDHPRLDKNLDLSSLPAYYDRYEATNNSQKILVFLKFMNDELGIESPNTDQFYTCFEKVNARVPKAFSQAFHDASGRKFGYIDYKSAVNITITTVGNNYFKFDLKKKGDE